MWCIGSILWFPSLYVDVSLTNFEQTMSSNDYYSCGYYLMVLSYVVNDSLRRTKPKPLFDGRVAVTRETKAIFHGRRKKRKRKEKKGSMEIDLTELRNEPRRALFGPCHLPHRDGFSRASLHANTSIAHDKRRNGFFFLTSPGHKKRKDPLASPEWLHCSTVYD